MIVFKNNCFINILIIFLFFFINIINSQTTEIKYYDENQSNTLIRYPTTFSSKECSYSFYFWIFQNDYSNGPLSIKSLTSLVSKLVPLGSNSTHALYKSTFTYPQSSSKYINEIIGLTNNDQSLTLTTNCECRFFNNSEIQFDVEIVGTVYSSILGYSVIYKTIGVPTYYEPLLLVNSFSVQNIRIGVDLFLSIINYSFMSITGLDLTAPLKLSIVFGDIWVNKTIASYYENYSDPNLKLYYYPNWENQIDVMSQSNYPVMIIETTSQLENPYFSLIYNGLFAYELPKIQIYQNNGINIYIATPKTLAYRVGESPSIQIYVQNNSKPLMKLNQTLNVIGTPITVITAFNLTSVVQDDPVPLYSCDFNNMEDRYHLNVFRIYLNNQYKEITAPYGFYGGNNSAYKFIIELPISPYNPTASIEIMQGFDYSKVKNTITIPGNTNVKDQNPPIIESYEFIYIRNSKYIFKVQISDDYCGVGSISFNSYEYIQISKYRSSGDKLNGIYEIPIDFELNLKFLEITVYDLCGLSNKVEFNEFGSTSVLFNKFVVPFFDGSYNLYNIKDITYDKNYLDVRDQSVGNTLYFSLDEADTKAPLNIITKEFNVINSDAVYVKEYYASWNFSINKFQIDFVVPKNSKLGAFDYFFAFLSPYQLLSSAPSSFFSSSSQLIISKSNFDGIGPIFSKVEKIPFSGGKFGWHLAISDPINGFDNGTITVTGSDDNSIYKFNLFPKDRIGGNVSEGIYEIIIDLSSSYCITQDYIITFVKLWDTGAHYTVFEFTNPKPSQDSNPMTNPLYLFLADPTINRYSIEECSTSNQDLTPPELVNFTASKTIIDVGTDDRNITFTLEIEDKESGININAQGPSIYITGEILEMVQCISEFKSNSTQFNALFECTIELPIGFASSYGIAFFSIYNIINKHGLYNGYSTQMLTSISLTHKVDIIYSLSAPLLLETGKALSRGGEFFVYGRSLSDVIILTITDTKTNQVQNYTNITLYGTSVISISNLAPIKNDFYVSLKTNKYNTNKLLVSPVLFNDYIPSQDSSSNNEEPLPTNAPQQCLGNPVCGGITHGTCNNQTGCVCIYPWKGKSCQDQIIEPEKPEPNPSEPSTNIDIPNYKSLISLYSLREIDINGKTVNNYPFNDKWTFIQVTDLKSYYQINITTGNSFNTTVSATLEWFNQSKTITFADQDLEMSANSIKYDIEISKYPFSSKLNYLQLVMSATLTSTSTDSCSSKDFGETTSGDNSNYINIQIDNKSLYGRFIKRGIIDDNKVISLSNEILDSTLNAISKPSQTQTYIGITIQYYEERLFIDPDFSVLLSSNSASSNSNSICKSKGLSGSKIAGIVIGATAFAAVIGISIVYYFKKKKDAKKFKSNITNKLKEMNNNGI